MIFATMQPKEYKGMTNGSMNANEDTTVKHDSIMTERQSLRGRTVMVQKTPQHNMKHAGQTMVHDSWAKELLVNRSIVNVPDQMLGPSRTRVLLS